MSLRGQVALVTGGGTGIGFIIAKGFTANGAKVYITGRREEILSKAAASLPAQEGVLIPLRMDVTDQTSIDEAVKYIQTTDGRLDILVNNAGVTNPLPSTYPDFGQKKMVNYIAGKDAFEHETFEGWNDVFSINTSAAFFVVRAFTDLLVKGAEARNSTACVINIGSVAAYIRSWIPILSLSFGASKAALEKVSVGLATDFARRKISIRVNVIHPGAFPSEVFPADSEALKKMDQPFPGYSAPTPFGRAGTEAEMAMTAVYLAACTYATGASVTVDGGLALVNP